MIYHLFSTINVHLGMNKENFDMNTLEKEQIKISFQNNQSISH